MFLTRPSGVALRAVALVVAAALAGGAQLLAPEDEHGHRCSCPAGAHACTCATCAARAAHAAPSGPPGAARPCCHGAAPAAPAPERPRSLPDAPCVASACGGRGTIAALSTEADPFVLPQHPLAAPPGRGDRFAPLAILSGGDLAAPEPPPPRA